MSSDHSLPYSCLDETFQIGGFLGSDDDVPAGLAAYEARRVPIGGAIIRHARHLGAHLQAQRSTAAEREQAERFRTPEAVMTETAVMNENAGPYAGMDRFACRSQLLDDLDAADPLKNVVAFHKLPEHGVASVEVGTRREADVELGAATVWIRISGQAHGPDLVRMSSELARDGRQVVLAAVTGLNHGHIYDQIRSMLNAGAEAVCFYAPEDDLAVQYRAAFPYIHGWKP